MKSLFAFGLPAVALLTAAFPAAAQVGSQHPLGGVYTSPYSNRPVIGTRPAAGSRGGYRGRSAGSVYAAPYAYSFYVPGYFDDSGYGYGYQDNSYPPVQPIVPPPPVVPPAPPVVINQYFGTPPPQYQSEAAPQGAPASDNQQPARPTTTTCLHTRTTPSIPCWRTGSRTRR